MKPVELTDREWRWFIALVVLVLIPVAWAFFADLLDVASAWTLLSPMPVGVRRLS